jgi:rhodanese-related sulfurtransferase
MIKEVNPIEAFKILEQQPDATLIDVRSTMEYEFVGHPLNAIHLPLREPPDWDTASDFVERLRVKLAEQTPTGVSTEDMPLLMLCRSGARSKLAGEMLIKDGFTDVYNVLEGFEGDKDDNGHRNSLNGWRFHGLPWEQS